MAGSKCSRRSSLITAIRRHYVIQGLQQIYKILGSLSIIGNPVGLVTNLGKGVTHLFQDPALVRQDWTYDRKSEC